MNPFKDQFEYDSVYFTKPGDTLEKACREVLPYGASSGDIELCKQWLINLNPRINKPSFSRFGNRLQPNKILSLDHSNQHGTMRGHVGADRLTQYQVQREETLLDMDPQVRDLFVQNSASKDPDKRTQLDAIAFQAQVKAHLEHGHESGHGWHTAKEYTLGAVHSFSHSWAHRVGHAVEGLEHAVKPFYEPGPKILGEYHLKKNFKSKLAHVGEKLGYVWKDTFTEYSAEMKLARRDMLKVHRSVVKGIVALPRGIAPVTDVSSSFKPMKAVRILKGAAVVAIAIEVSDRVKEVMRSEDRPKEALIQTGRFAGNMLAVEASVYLACSVILGAMTWGPGVFFCPVIVGAGATYGFKYFTEADGEEVPGVILR